MEEGQPENQKREGERGRWGAQPPTADGRLQQRPVLRRPGEAPGHPVTEHQGCLVGCGPLLRSVGTGAVSGPLSDEEQALPEGALLHLEELVLHMGEPDAQRQAPVGGGDIPLGSQVPGPRAATAARLGEVEHGRGDPVHGGDTGSRDLEHQLGAATNPGRRRALGVAASCVNGEGGLPAGGVREVVVIPFPGAVVPMEGEDPGEEEHGRAHLAPRADPAAAQVQGQGRLAGQHGRVVLVGAGDEAAGRAGAGVVLAETKGRR